MRSPLPSAKGLTLVKRQGRSLGVSVLNLPVAYERAGGKVEEELAVLVVDEADALVGDAAAAIMSVSRSWFQSEKATYPTQRNLCSARTRARSGRFSARSLYTRAALTTAERPPWPERLTAMRPTTSPPASLWKVWAFVSWADT